MRSRDGERLAVMFGGEAEEERYGAFGPFSRAGIGGGGTAKATAKHVGVNDAWVEGDGGHAGGKFLSEGLGEAFDGPFGGAIGSDFGICGAAPSRTEIDDDAGALRDHG